MKPALLPCALAAFLLPAGPASAQRAQPIVSMQAARATALAALPRGRIQSAELEREHGRLIYSFDIQVPGRPGIEEVQVSAVNGRVVSRQHESPAAEHREQRTEAREHRPRR